MTRSACPTASLWPCALLPRLVVVTATKVAVGVTCCFSVDACARGCQWSCRSLPTCPVSRCCFSEDASAGSCQWNCRSVLHRENGLKPRGPSAPRAPASAPSSGCSCGAVSAEDCPRLQRSRLGPTRWRAARHCCAASCPSSVAHSCCQASLVHQ